MGSLDSLNYSPSSISSSNFARRGKGFSMMAKTSSLAWWCKFVAPNRCECWPDIRKEELQPADSSPDAAIERLKEMSPDLSKCAAAWSGLWKVVIVSQSAGVDKEVFFQWLRTWVIIIKSRSRTRKDGTMLGASGGRRWLMGENPFKTK